MLRSAGQHSLPLDRHVARDLMGNTRRSVFPEKSSVVVVDPSDGQLLRLHLSVTAFWASNLKTFCR